MDFFEDAGAVGPVVDLAQELRKTAGGTPLLFTCRSARERGGEAVPLSDDQVVELYRAVCEARSIDLIDFEMDSDPDRVRRLRRVSQDCGTKTILSYHNFRHTPPMDAIQGKFRQAQQQQADIAKVAVMPDSREDVLTLLAATLASSETLDIPLISISMGGYDALSRMFGWVFGSAVSFAVGERGSAPGQLPVEDLNTVIGIARKAMGGP